MKQLVFSAIWMTGVTVLACAAVATPAVTNVSAPAPVAQSTVASNQAADIARVEEYLSSLTTVVADFSQVDAAGNLASGRFYMKRPGKMRWQYAPPTPILLVSDGKVITYYDAELDQVNYIGVDDTLAGFLAQKVIKLDGATTKLTKFEAQDGAIRATMIQRKKPDEGSLTLEFSDKPLLIRQMAITDASGKTTRVQLQNAKFGDPLADKLFTFEDPRGINRRNRQ